MSTYGLNQCPELVDGKCSKIYDENALVDLGTEVVGEEAGSGGSIEVEGEAAGGSSGGEEGEEAVGSTSNPDAEAAAANQQSEQEAMRAKVNDLASYEWSVEATPLKDSIYELLNTLMQVDMKYKEFSNEMGQDQAEKLRIEQEMQNLQKSLENITNKITGKAPEEKAANNYKEILKAANQ